MTVIDSTFNAAFISTDAFGVSAAFKVNGTGIGASIVVNDFLEGGIIETEAGGVETDEPFVQAISTDVTGADHDSILVIDGTNWYVVSADIDRHGMTILLLSEQQIT